MTIENSDVSASGPGNSGFGTPPPPPRVSQSGRLFTQLALLFAIIALVAALPILWQKLLASPTSASLVGEVIAEITHPTQTAANLPIWYAGVRAASVLSAFLSLILVLVALIMGAQRRLLAIAAVLCLAAFAVSAPWLTLLALGVLLMIPISLMLIGAM
jgi:hypothetical protein